MTHGMGSEEQETAMGSAQVKGGRTEYKAIRNAVATCDGKETAGRDDTT